MKKLLILALYTISASCSFAQTQAARVDIPLQTFGPNVPQSGGPLPQALWVSNATVQVCQHPSAIGSCIPMTTYNDANEDAACPPSTPMVQLPGTACTASTGTASNIGFWYGGGIVDYIVSASFGTFGPYTVNPPFPSGSVGCLATGNSLAVGCTGGTSQSSAFNSIVAPGGTMTGPLSGPVLNGIYGASQFGIKCDGSTDDSTALNSIGTFVAAQPAGSTVTVSFPSNSTCLHASTINTWLVANLHISGNGARLKFTGTGDQIVLHNSVEVDNVWIDGFVLQGNPASTWGIFADTTQARGELQFINIQDQATGCAHLGNVQLMNKLDITCSAQKATEMGVPQVTQPGIGVQAGDTSEPFANNRYVNITAEGVSGIGLWINTTVDGDVFSGTSESNGTGVQIEPDNEGVAFSGFDVEHNTTAFVDNNGSSVQIATSGFQVALGSEATGVMSPQYLVGGNLTPPNGRTACITQDLSGFLTTEFWQSSTTGGQSCGTSRTLALTPTEAIFPGSVNAANGNIIGTQGTQYHIRQFVTVSSGCTAAANASCQFTVTWPNAFPNAAYAMICYLGNATGVGVVVGDANPTSTSTTVSFRDLSGASNTASQTFCEAWE